MAFTASYSDIDKAYAACIPVGDPKAQVRGQPNHHDFYYVRKIYWLYTQGLALGGNAFAQVAMRIVPYVAVINNNVVNVSVTHNSEVFTWVPTDIYVMRQNEADFVIQKSTQLGTPLTITTLAAWFAGGKTNFFYW